MNKEELKKADLEEFSWVMSMIRPCKNCGHNLGFHCFIDYEMCHVWEFNEDKHCECSYFRDLDGYK